MSSNSTLFLKYARWPPSSWHWASASPWEAWMFWAQRIRMILAKPATWLAFNLTPLPKCLYQLVLEPDLTTRKEKSFFCVFSCCVLPPCFVFVRRLRALGGQGGRGEREQRRQEGDGTKMVHFCCRRVYEATVDLQAASSSGGLSIASECACAQCKLIGSARGKYSWNKTICGRGE